MELSGPFHINDKTYTREALLKNSASFSDDADLNHWQTGVFRFIRDFLQPGVPLAQKTSGTTGEPKTIRLDRAAMIESARLTIAHFNLSPGDKALLCLSLDYIAGKMMVIRALVGGLNLQTMEPGARPLQNLDTPVEFAAMVPLQLFESLKNGDPVHRIKKLLIGGGEISHRLRSDIQNIEDVEVFETFGMSETYTHFAVRKINGLNPDPSFKLLKGVRVEKDSRGCIVVDMPGITQGPVTTNDLVEITIDGGFEWLGRIDNVINSGGIKINPESLEKKIRNIIELELAVSALPDPKLGETIVLVLESATPELPLNEWDKAFKEVLVKHEIPKQIISITEIPRNRLTKIDRIKLKNMLIELVQSGSIGEQ